MPRRFTCVPFATATLGVKILRCRRDSRNRCPDRNSTARIAKCWSSLRSKLRRPNCRKAILLMEMRPLKIAVAIARAAATPAAASAEIYRTKALRSGASIRRKICATRGRINRCARLGQLGASAETHHSRRGFGFPTSTYRSTRSRYNSAFPPERMRSSVRPIRRC